MIIWYQKNNTQNSKNSTEKKINKQIQTYLPILPIDTKSKNGKKEYLKLPATKVIGSPIKGTQLNKSDHFPYLEKNEDALSIFVWFIGNHFFLIK